MVLTLTELGQFSVTLSGSSVNQPISTHWSDTDQSPTAEARWHLPLPRSIHDKRQTVPGSFWCSENWHNWPHSGKKPILNFLAGHSCSMSSHVAMVTSECSYVHFCSTKYHMIDYLTFFTTGSLCPYFPSPIQYPRHIHKPIILELLHLISGVLQAHCGRGCHDTST